jgi:SOS-response transcriptional repressor LexA
VTSLQADALAFITRFISTRDISPTYREIREGCGIKHDPQVSRVLDYLVEQGYLAREGGVRARRLLLGQRKPVPAEVSQGLPVDRVVVSRTVLPAEAGDAAPSWQQLEPLLRVRSGDAIYFIDTKQQPSDGDIAVYRDPFDFVRINPHAAPRPSGSLLGCLVYSLREHRHGDVASVRF